MHLTFKYRLYPTDEQEAFLDAQLRSACEFYNAALQERIGAWKLRQSVSLYDQTYQLKHIRAAGDIDVVNFSCALDVIYRVDRAFKAFFRRVKNGPKKAGFPRYRSQHRYDSLTFTKGCRLLSYELLHLQGTTPIKIHLHRPPDIIVKQTTIKREAGRWFVCFSGECRSEILPKSATEIGIDVGLTHFATLSNGETVKNPRYYRKAQKCLRCTQRKVARRKRGSHRRQKAVRLLQRANIHVRNQRADFHHKESRKIVNSYGLIAVEDLSVQNMVSGRFAKSVQDAGWTSFLDKLAYKAARAGRDFRKVNPRGTSQTCVCGAAAPKTLYDRWHYCEVCGLSAPRDIVSAQIILQRARTEPSSINVEVSHA